MKMTLPPITMEFTKQQVYDVLQEKVQEQFGLTPEQFTMYEIIEGDYDSYNWMGIKVTILPEGVKELVKKGLV